MPELDIPDDSRHTVQTELIHKACTEPTNTPEFPWNNQYLLEKTLLLKGLKKKDTRCLEVVNNQKENRSKKKGS